MYKTQTHQANFIIEKESVPLQLRNLILRLLECHPAKRLGGLQGVEKVKNDLWFKEVKIWRHVSELWMVPPSIPESNVDRTEFFPDKSQIPYDLIEKKTERRAGLMLQGDQKTDFQDNLHFGELMWDVTRDT